MRLLRLLSSLFIIGVVFLSCNQAEERLPADLINNPSSASGEKSEQRVPQITFEKTAHDYGRLIMGEKVSYSFKFTNTGNADLIISNVSASCGCTVPRFTSDPVKPGESGNVTVVFDSHNRRGFQNKTVDVITNTNPNRTVLSVQATIVTPDRG